MTTRGSTVVADAPERSRYEISVDGALAGFALYKLAPDRITFVHTEIDDAYSGHGLGGQLARAALDDVRARGLAVRPDCPFIKGWIAKHPDYADLGA